MHPREGQELHPGQYLNACIFRYSINFFKWRSNQNLNKGIENPELDDFIEQRLLILKERHKYYKKQIKHRLSDPEQQKNKLSIAVDAKIKASFVKNPTKPKAHQISDPSQLGWPKFSKQIFQKKHLLKKYKTLATLSSATTQDKMAEDVAYSSSKLEGGEVPIMVYLPSAGMLYTLIRSCCFVEEVEELIYYLPRQ